MVGADRDFWALIQPLNFVVTRGCVKQHNYELCVWGYGWVCPRGFAQSRTWLEASFQRKARTQWPFNFSSCHMPRRATDDQLSVMSGLIQYTGYRILWHPVTHIRLWHYFANPKFIQKCHFITVGLSPCDKVSLCDYFLAWARVSHNIRSSVKKKGAVWSKYILVYFGFQMHFSYITFI